MPRPTLIASNRGPVSFEVVDGLTVASRGAGGLVSALAPLVRGTDTIWVAAALTAGDRSVAGPEVTEAEGFNIALLDIDPDDLDLAYNTIANETLWYLHHDLYDRARRPVIDTEWYDAWSAFRRYNDAFAQAIIDLAAPNSIVLLQDHHVALAAPAIRDARPDCSIIHFSHTPFASPSALRVLPELARTELLLGYLAADAQGFHSSRWSDDFVACCRETLGVRPSSTFVSPLGPDVAELQGVAASAACDARLEQLDQIVGERFVIARAERLEPSKNLLRGFWAFDEFLALRPELHGDVIFVAALSPSRTAVPDYITYRQEIEDTVEEINARWGRDGWTPVHYVAQDDYHFAVAILRRFDALLINPIRDGMNLVAKEGPIVNERDGVVLLSREAGAFDELAGLVTEVHAYDITQTAQAMSDAVDMAADHRADLAADIRDIAGAREPRIWFDEQIAAADPEIDPSAV